MFPTYVTMAHHLSLNNYGTLKAYLSLTEIIEENAERVLKKYSGCGKEKLNEKRINNGQ